MSEEKISSNESEGAFNEFVEDQLDEMLESIINEGDLSNIGDRHSDVIVEMDDIEVPTFSYGDQGSGRGRGGAGPGKDGGGKMRFSLPFEQLMDLIAESLKLPDLTKEGKGKIKEFSYEFKTFGQMGVILDKRRTFKRALKSNLALGLYAPDQGRYDVQIMRRDKRFKIPERVEKPKFRAVVFYMGDISYSTYGERLSLEKRLVNFSQSWLDYNYGPGNVEHRFFVHDMDAYEVQADDFYNVSNMGGTRASGVFDLVFQIAFNEYDTATTNYYAFYFGDGELFDDDARQILETLEDLMRPLFNRIGIVEVQPGRLSLLNRQVATRFNRDPIIRLSEINDKQETIDVIKILFGEQ
ncbi:MAG: DUF444 family protein [SAR324 cluster bacterium]|nr:DUF444 family protein [SAR324 cluster bacterium]